MNRTEIITHIGSHVASFKGTLEGIEGNPNVRFCLTRINPETGMPMPDGRWAEPDAVVLSFSQTTPKGVGETSRASIHQSIRLATLRYAGFGAIPRALDAMRSALGGIVAVGLDATSIHVGPPRDARTVSAASMPIRSA